MVDDKRGCGVWLYDETGELAAATVCRPPTLPYFLLFLIQQCRIPAVKLSGISFRL
jgi:hypothetical protein